MTADELKNILDNKEAEWDGDNALKGLLILSKYIDHGKCDLICGAGHDQIWSVSLDKICQAGLTEDDAKALATLNWMVEDGHLSCFV